MYYLSGENKGVYQLCSYCTADLRLCSYAKIWFSYGAAKIRDAINKGINQNADSLFTTIYAERVYFYFQIDEMNQCQNCYYMSNAKPRNWFAQPCVSYHVHSCQHCKNWSLLFCIFELLTNDIVNFEQLAPDPS